MFSGVPKYVVLSYEGYEGYLLVVMEQKCYIQISVEHSLKGHSRMISVERGREGFSA